MRVEDGVLVAEDRGLWDDVTLFCDVTLCCDVTDFRDVALCGDVTLRSDVKHGPPSTSTSLPLAILCLSAEVKCYNATYFNRAKS